jgi:REP element-mobilizing transposase RayT
MVFDANLHYRRSIRLKGYDYSQAGLYFITICTKNRECLFGKIEKGVMILNQAGKIADECWMNIQNHFPNVRLHEYVVMPNHVHGILEITNVADRMAVGTKKFSPVKRIGDESARAKNRSLLHPPSKTVGSIVRGFKIGVTKWFHENTNINDVWHRNYYEHIMRDNASFQTITNYILNNPQKWDKDKFYI